MKRGESYITFIVKDKPKHPIVKALRQKYGSKYDNDELIYANHWSDCCG